MNSLRLIVVLASLAFPVGGALAQSAKDDFPNRPLRSIIPFPPGGASDIYARIIAREGRRHPTQIVAPLA